MASIDNVPAADWRHWTNENRAIILDVREPAEWAMGTLPGAELISLHTLGYRLGELDKNTPVLAICRSGSRSGYAAALMVRAGFRKVGNLIGGLQALGMAA